MSYNKNRHKKTEGTENNLPRFHIYLKTKLACKFNTQLYKTQYSEILVEYEIGFDMKLGKLKLTQLKHTTVLVTKTNTSQ